MEIKWENDFKISVGIRDGEATLSANREGLRSLANILLALENETPGSHIHLDRYNSLEDDSAELVIELTE